MKNRFKEKFAELAVKIFRKKYSDIYKKQGDTQIFSIEFIYNNLEKPKNPKKGRYSFPVFKSSKLLSEKPN